MWLISGILVKHAEAPDSRTPNMKTINRHQLICILAAIKGAKPLTITALTEAKCNKTAIMRKARAADGREILLPTGLAGKNTYNAMPEHIRADNVLVSNPYPEVRKLNKINGFTSVNYESAVQRQEMREGKLPLFAARERTWGTRISGALVEQDGKFYLVIQPKATGKPVYFARIGDMLKQVTKDKIAAFLPPHRSHAESQGVDVEVPYRNYSLDSVVALAIDGEQYRIRD